MSHAGEAVATILTDFYRVPDVALFDEHSEYDAEGNLLRRFDEKRLQAICDHNNKRATESGNLASFGPGHTIEDGPEESQPEKVAFAHNWTVKPFVKPDGTLGVPTIHADMYVRPDQVERVRSLPHRSIELWTRDPDGKRIPGYVDHIALLRQTPKRDLGFLAFQKGETITLPSQAKLYGRPARAQALLASERGGKLYYAMECNPMDPTAPANALAPDQAFLDKLKQALMALSPQFAAMLQPPPPPAPPAPPAAPPPLDAPGGDPPAPGGLDAPGGDPPMPEPKEDKPVPFSKTANARSAENRMAYLERQYAELLASHNALKAEKENEKLSFSKSDAESLVDILEREGHILDRDVEVKYLSDLPLGEKRKERFDYLKRITRTGHGSDLPPHGMLDFDTIQPSGGKEMAEHEMKAAVQYMRKTNCSWDDAVLKFKKAQ